MGKVRLKKLRNRSADEHYPSIIALCDRVSGAISLPAHALCSPRESPRRLRGEDARADLHAGYHRARGRRAIECAEESGAVQCLGAGLEPRIPVAEHAPGWR